MRRVKLGIVSLAATIFLGSAVIAYEGGGHYYTIGFVLMNLVHNPPTDQTRLPKDTEASYVAFCAQLPDIATELDAVKVYSSLPFDHPYAYARWACCDKEVDPSIGQMIAVEQLLHGLTGGNADDVQKVAAEIVAQLTPPQWRQGGGASASDSTALCALGFALHLYGDSFAHKQLDHPDTMYPTGEGHAGDFSFPDYPLYERDANVPTRSKLWSTYLHNVPTFLEKFALDPIVEQKTVSQVLSLPSTKNLNVFNRYGEGDLSDILVGGIKNRIEFNPPPKMDDGAPCQSYINEVFKQKHFAGMAPPQCEAVWGLFRQTAESVFKNHPKSRDIRWSTLPLVDPRF